MFLALVFLVMVLSLGAVGVALLISPPTRLVEWICALRDHSREPKQHSQILDPPNRAALLPGDE